jgi:hypothetical protein
VGSGLKRWRLRLLGGENDGTNTGKGLEEDIVCLVEEWEK